MIELKIDKNCVEFTFKGSLKYMRIEALSKFYKENNVQESDQRYVLERQIVTWEVWDSFVNPPTVEQKVKVKEVKNIPEKPTLTKIEAFKSVKRKLQNLNYQGKRIKLFVHYVQTFEPQSFSQGWSNPENIKKTEFTNPQLMELQQILLNQQYQAKIGNQLVGEVRSIGTADTDIVRENNLLKSNQSDYIGPKLNNIISVISSKQLEGKTPTDYEDDRQKDEDRIKAIKGVASAQAGWRSTNSAINAELYFQANDFHSNY